MKRYIKSLFSAIIIGLFVFLLSGCNIKDPSQIFKIKPVYEEMIISKTVTTLSLGNSGTEINQDDPFEEIDDGNILNVLTNNYEVTPNESADFYAQTNDDIYIVAHLRNPDRFIMNSITLNNVVYSKNQFEIGSNFENIVIKLNTGTTEGIIEYAISSIKYEDGTLMKDVVLGGGVTTKHVGIQLASAPSVLISDEMVGSTSFSLTISLSDSSNASILNKTALYDGTSLLQVQDLTIGENELIFDKLIVGTLYQYAVFSVYDLIDGQDNRLEILYMHAFYTDNIVEISNTQPTQNSVTFDLTVSDTDEVGSISAIELYKGETLIESLSDLSIREFTGLLSNNEYLIKVTYTYDLNDGEGNRTFVYEQLVTTLAKATPIVVIDNVLPTQTGIDFGITITDVDQVGSITAIELYKGETLIESLTDLSVRTFTGLLSNNEYLIKVTYTYDLNDGDGERLLMVNQTVTTVAKATPIVIIDNVVPTQTSIGFGITVTDLDQVGSISAIELYKGETLIESLSDLSIREFTGLLSDNEYTIIVTYIYDAQDGLGARELAKSNKTIFTSKTIPEVGMVFYSHDMNTISYDLIINDPDSALTLQRIYSVVYIIKTGDPMNPIRTEYEMTLDSFGSFVNLDSGNTHYIYIECIVNLNDGMGDKIITTEKQFTTSKMPVSFSVSGAGRTQESLTFVIHEANEDGVIKQDFKCELYNSDKSILISNDFDVAPELLWGWVLEYDYTYLDLLSNNEYVLVISYKSDLNDDLGLREFVSEFTMTTLSKRTPSIEIDNIEPSQSTIGFDITVTDVDLIGAISAIELYKGETLIEALTDLTVREFTCLLSDNEYTIKATYTYDLNDGEGNQTFVYEQLVTTEAKATPEINISNIVETQSSVVFDLTEIDSDEVGAISTIELYKGETLIESLNDLSVRIFTGLLSNNEYTIKVTYIYDLNDGEGNLIFEVGSEVITLPNAPEITSVEILTNNLKQYDTLFLVINISNIESINIDSVCIDGIFYTKEVASSLNTLYIKYPVYQEGGLFELNIESLKLSDNRTITLPIPEKFNIIVFGELDIKNISLKSGLLYGGQTLSYVVELYNPTECVIESISFYYLYTGVLTKLTKSNFATISPTQIEFDLNFGPYTGNQYIQIRRISFSYSNVVNSKEVVFDENFMILDNMTPIEIATAQDLLNIQGGYRLYKLTNDIDLSSVNWIPRVFTGFLDGNNFAITNLRIIDYADIDESYIGLFSQNYGIIQNLKLSDVYISVEKTRWTYVGMLTGLNLGKIQNVQVEGIIDVRMKVSVYAENAYSSVGGIIGIDYANNGVSKLSIINSSITLNQETAHGYLGGIIGSYESSRQAKLYQVCVHNLSIYTDGRILAGGILGIGSQNGTTDIFDSYVDGLTFNVNDALNYVGGISGSNLRNIKNVYVANVVLNGTPDSFSGIADGFVSLMNSFITDFSIVIPANSSTTYGYFLKDNTNTINTTNSYISISALLYKDNQLIEYSANAIINLENTHSLIFYDSVLNWSSDIWDFTNIESGLPIFVN